MLSCVRCGDGHAGRCAFEAPACELHRHRDARAASINDRLRLED